jgi:muconate cycloisomerase
VAGLNDVDRLRTARQALGQDVTFTIDYNGAFNNVEGAVASIESLLPFNLALVEQPTHRDRLSLLAQVRKRVDVPILADECIFSPEHLAEAIDLDAFDLLSLYPGKNGGFTHAVRMAQMAHRAGKTCAIGSNLESDLGQAAMATLAAGLTAFPIPQVPCDLGSSLYYTQSSLKEPLKLVAGELQVPHGVGFGVEPDIQAGLRPPNKT